MQSYSKSAIEASFNQGIWLSPGQKLQKQLRLSRVLLKQSPIPNLKTIQITVGRVFGVTLANLTSPRRSAQFGRARQAAMYLCREFTGCSYAEIGLAFHRHHTTALYACRAMEAQEKEASTLTAIPA